MFDAKTYREEKVALVTNALADHMPKTSEKPERLHEAMRYAVLNGGKRLRPLLCLAAAESVGAKAEQALIPALALELLHAYTLVHDDLPAMDDDELRRGQPTVHKKFGEVTAILVGDALLTLAFEILAQQGSAELVRELATAAGSRGVVGGQEVDLALADAQPNEADIEYIHSHKTAKLFVASVRLGGLAGAGSDAALAALTNYGENLGRAYQLIDDYNDGDGAVELYGAPQTREQAEGYLATARGAIEALPGATDGLNSLVDYFAAQLHG